MLVLIASGGGSRRFFFVGEGFWRIPNWSKLYGRMSHFFFNVFPFFFHVNTHKKWTYEKRAHYGPFISVFEMEGWPGHVCDICMEFLLLSFRAWINKNLNPLETLNWVVVSTTFLFSTRKLGKMNPF